MNFSTLTPLKNRILAKKIQTEQLSEGGLFLGTQEDSKFARYATIRTGVDVSPSITTNHVLVTGIYAGTKLDDEYIILTEDDILGIE